MCIGGTETPVPEHPPQAGLAGREQVWHNEGVSQDQGGARQVGVPGAEELGLL